MSLTIYSEEELKKIQYIETECLGEFIKICQQLHLEYFLVAGSALGAMRHNGFIPWDDDLDVGMTRPNYERFLKEAPALLPSRYHLQTPYNTPTTPYPYTKIRIDGTKFVEYCNRNIQMHHGVYMDIFPFDKMPTSNIPNWIQFYTVKLLIRLFTLRQTPDLTTPPSSVTQHIKYKLRRGLHNLCRLIPFSWIRWMLYRTQTHYNGLTDPNAYAWTYIPCSGRNKGDLFYPQELYPLQDHVFNGLKVKIANQCRASLVRHYGDWEKYPPIEKRFGHKPFRVDLG